MTDLTMNQTEGQPAQIGHCMEDYLRAAKEQYNLALGCVQQSVQHVWKMGKALTEAKERHKVRKQKVGKEEPNWDVLLKQIGISVASDNRARRMVAAYPKIEQVMGMGIMEAYQEAGIAKLPGTNASEPVTSVNSQTNARTQSESITAGNSGTSADEGDEVDPTEVANYATGCGNDDDDSIEDDLGLEDDFESEEDDLLDDRTIVEMVLDISTDMEALRDRNDTLSAEEINAVLAEVERIAQYALDIKVRLEEGIEALA